MIYEYDDIKGEPHAVAAANINPYLVDAPDVVLPRRSSPICAVPEIGIGNKPIDDGNYLFTAAERDAFVALEPASAKWFRRWLGADEFLNGYERWCLWLGDCPPAELRAMPEAMKRVQAVKSSRLASKSPPTQKLAETPTRFHVEFMPSEPYMVIPEVSCMKVDRSAFLSRLMMLACWVMSLAKEIWPRAALSTPWRNVSPSSGPAPRWLVPGLPSSCPCSLP